VREKTIIDLKREKREHPDQVDIGRAVDAVAAYRHLGEIKAVAALALLNGGGTYSAAFTGARAERLQLIGLLDELKAALIEHQDTPLIERLPGEK